MKHSQRLSFDVAHFTGEMSSTSLGLCAPTEAIHSERRSGKVQIFDSMSQAVSPTRLCRHLEEIHTNVLITAQKNKRHVLFLSFMLIVHIVGTLSLCDFIDLMLTLVA